jgi:hypothetical protein
MFSKDFPINEDIVENRLGKSLSTYCEELVEVIENLHEGYNILNGLGSVLDKKRRDWAKDNLLKELRKYLVSNSV